MIRIALWTFTVAFFVAYAITHPQTGHNINNPAQVTPW